MLDDDLISDQTRELPEVQLPVVVYFHADMNDRQELRRKIDEIRYRIESALGSDDDPDVRSYVYPEVRVAEDRAKIDGLDSKLPL